MDSPYLHEWAFDHAACAADAPAIGGVAARLTYGEVADRALRLAAALAERGIGHGDRVLMALSNTPATVVAGLACNVLGATILETSRAWGAETLAALGARFGASAAFLLEQDLRAWGSAGGAWAPRVRLLVVAPRAGASDGAVTSDGAGAPDGAPPGAESVIRLPEHGDPGDGVPLPDGARPGLRPDDTALVVFTSGSTGRPRGVIQTFANIDANTRAIVASLGLTAADRALLTLPLFYCYGRSVLQSHLLAGASVYLENRTAFPRTIVDSMAAQASTGFAGVPLTFELFRRHLDPAAIDLPALRYLTQAGGPMTHDTTGWVRSTFAPARLFVMYGQTEATARLTVLPPEMADRKPGSIGTPIDGVEVRVVDEAGREVEAGVSGELEARGGNVTPGYLDEPAATAEILRDGWLRTGDLAHRDTDGFLFIDGRAREFLKIHGHRVSPARIEEAVARHPDVIEVAVVGRVDALAGEVAVAAVVLRRGATLDPESLRHVCEPVLARHEVPAEFRQVDRLPRNEAGKLQRAALATSLLSQSSTPASPSRPRRAMSPPTRNRSEGAS